MGMYNMIHGVNNEAGLVLHSLNIKPEEVERLRDAGIDVENEQLWIYTRTGGGNREYHPNETLTEHELYIRDEDDDFDCTYATYYFKVPECLKELIEEAKRQGVKGNKPVDWAKFFREQQ